MTEYVLLGKLSIGYDDDYQKIRVMEPDGNVVDIIERMRAVKNFHPKGEISISIHSSNKPITKSKAVRGLMEFLYGDVDAQYTRNSYCYSSYTHGVDFNSYLTVGGHNLFEEWWQHDGKYVCIIINVK